MLDINEAHLIKKLRDSINHRMNLIFNGFCEYHYLDKNSHLAQRARAILEEAARIEFENDLNTKTKLDELTKIASN
jgi:hypothetical protein